MLPSWNHHVNIFFTCINLSVHGMHVLMFLCNKLIDFWSSDTFLLNYWDCKIKKKKQENKRKEKKTNHTHTKTFTRLSVGNESNRIQTSSLSVLMACNVGILDWKQYFFLQIWVTIDSIIQIFSHFCSHVCGPLRKLILLSWYMYKNGYFH